MTETIAVALLSLAGTLFGSYAGIRRANELVAYRLQELEKKVSAHNRLVERTFALESRMAAAEQALKRRDPQ